MRFRPSRRQRRACAWVLALAVAFALAARFAPFVRGRVAEYARAKGVEIEVGTVRPAWLGVVLRDVRVRPLGGGGWDARLEEVRVALSPRLHLERVAAPG